jgi:hypothetical protein
MTYARTFALFMHFYPGMTEDKIWNLPWKAFINYVRQIAPLVRMFNGFSTINNEDLSRQAKIKGLM